MTIRQNLMYFRNLKHQFIFPKRIPLEASKFLVVSEFPKCGGSWLSCILANLLNCHGNSSGIYIHPFNMYSRVVDIDLAKTSRGKSIMLHNLSPDSYLIKTHAPFSINFQRIVCLYRNPISVFQSYYRMCLSQNIIKDMSPLAFVKHRKFGVSAYNRFYVSYLNSSENSKIQFVDYDDLKRNTAAIVSQISNIFLPNKSTQTHETKLIQLACLKNYIELEKSYLRLDPRREMLHKSLKSVNSFNFMGDSRLPHDWSQSIDQYIIRKTSKVYDSLRHSCSQIVN